MENMIVPILLIIFIILMTIIYLKDSKDNKEELKLYKIELQRELHENNYNMAMFKYEIINEVEAMVEVRIQQLKKEINNGTR